MKGGSSFHLNTPEDAAAVTQSSILLEQGTPTVSVEIEGLSRSLIIDTGSNVSILQPTVSSRGVSHPDQTARRDGGSPRCKGVTDGHFLVEQTRIYAHVFSLLTPH